MINIQPQDIKTVDGRILLRQFSASVASGERVALTGPNGCGKSTILRLIAGVDSPGSGIRGRFLMDLERMKISYLPTRPLDLILPWASVEKNITLFSNMCHKDIRHVFQQFESYASGMEQDSTLFRHQIAYKLSSGHQAFVAIFCALIQSPELLIADEIFSTLAEKTKGYMAAWLTKHNFTMVLASHDSDFINALGARRISLDPYLQ